MLQKSDYAQLEKMGMSPEKVEKELRQIAEGFPFMRLVGPARVGAGIMSLTPQEREEYKVAWRKYVQQSPRLPKVVKFVPASGAASRMFKSLFAFLLSENSTPESEFEKQFFAHIKEFAFFDELDKVCQKNCGKGVSELMENNQYKAVVDNLLDEKGLNYGNLPKGLLLFHNHSTGVRAAMEEHLVEAANYAKVGGVARIHFTVSPAHLPLFKAKLESVLEKYSRWYGVRYEVSFSCQKPSTDTIATNIDNTPFRNEDGTLLFRPGGHGALIENLGDIDADVVFIKNIDNVVPEQRQADTTEYKQVLAGVLVSLQEKAFGYLERLDAGGYDRDKLNEMLSFVENELYCHRADAAALSLEELAAYLRRKLNRPMRVCGVVKNVGEPGGGPFVAYNQDGTTSLQILESSQIDFSNEEYAKMFKEGTHFNPVDLVCGIKNYKGEAFDLTKYVDHLTGFISTKSKGGKELRALELPGLWNGAMSDWSTVFVEVPLTTFNPVKTVVDLLREEHSK